ncbi:MAG: YeeE/YedE thiosulfate transporter family protein [Acidilobaceae archaeon]
MQTRYSRGIRGVLVLDYVFSPHYRLYVLAFILGLTSVLMSYSQYLLAGRGSLWGITTGESKLGGWFWYLLIDPRISETLYYNQFKLIHPLADPTQMIVIGIFIGGLVASLTLGEFAIKHIPNRWMLIQAIIGGFLLGYGARLALGCNIGNYLSAWASAGVNALSFTLGMLPGVWLGTIILERVFLERARPYKFSIRPSRRNQYLLALIVLVLLAILYLNAQGITTKIWLVFGLIFGFVGYASRLCWATGLREITNPLHGTGGRMLIAVAITIIVYSIGVWPLIIIDPNGVSLSLAKGAGQIQIFIGGVLFGIGMGLAGSCIFSSEWRAGSGSIYALTVLLSTILLGMPILAYHYETWIRIIPQVYPNLSFYHILGPLGVVAPLSYTVILLLIANQDLRVRLLGILSLQPLRIRVR